MKKFLGVLFLFTTFVTAFAFEWEVVDGVLTISGNGDMPNFVDEEGYGKPRPWDEYDITKVIIKEGVTSIGDWAFAVTSLTSVTIPNSVTSIGDGAFASTSLESVEIPNSVTSIGDEAFSYCESLISITIPNSVTSIGNSAFSSTALESIEVSPDNAYYKTIGNHLFSKDGSTLIQYALADKASSYTIPSGVTSIGDYAFSRTSLTSVSIPNSVTSIGDEAFAFTSLTSISIPNSVTSIGDWAFEDCYSLRSISISAHLEDKTDDWELPDDCEIKIQFPPSWELEK